jgi:hypothetical protein
LPPPPDLLYRKHDNHEQRIKNPNAHGCSLVTQWLSDKHFRLIEEAFAAANAFLSALDTSAATTAAQLAT